MIKILTIEGMMCSHCVAHVEEALKKVNGVMEVAVNLENKTAKVISDIEISDNIFKEVISEEGYEVTNIE